eukprot:TRINITY_DN749_c0_g1_i3.p1 TRINITY_DN749_c0_g1~~TRINITY_DN749_c0_g1_i3.p1  ORF type:complete len:205 (-),score=24.43 TRINITY_DN749_c0_g1_i3:112-726(-)
MIGGKFLFGRKYDYSEYLSTLSLCLALLMLVIEKYGFSGSMKIEGLIIITGALTADGIFGHIQESLMSNYAMTRNEMLYYSHVMGSVLILPLLVAKNEIPGSIYFCIENPSILPYMILHGLSMYIGLGFVVEMIRVFGTFVAMTVTSCRKFFSIVLSFLLFPKNLSFVFILSVLLVTFGVGNNIIYQNREKEEKPSPEIAIEHV